MFPDEEGTIRDSGDGILSDEQMRVRQVASRPRRRGTDDPAAASTYQIEKVAAQPSSFDDFGAGDGDASPIAMSSSSAGDDEGGGSTWERLRQRASRSSPGKSQGQGQGQDQAQAPSTTATSEAWSRARAEGIRAGREQE
jgi:hypothetical protein